MAKVKEDTSIPYIEEDGTENRISVLFYCDEEEGYGVEVMDLTTGIADISFGQDNLALAYRAYQWAVDSIQKDHNFTDVLMDLDCRWPDEMTDFGKIYTLIEAWEEIYMARKMLEGEQ